MPRKKTPAAPQVPLPDARIEKLIERISQQEQEVQDPDGRWYSMRLRPYRASDHRMDGARMILVDLHGIQTTRATRRDQSSLAAALMETSGALVMVTDAHGRVLAFNRACQIVSGYKLEDIAGQVIWGSGLIPKAEVAGERAVYRRLAAGRGPLEHEGRWVAKNGASRLISWNSASLPVLPGRPRQLIRIGTDITERREMETARENALRLSQSQLQALAAGLLTAQEEERARVARDLHDDISQKLAMLNLEAESALRKEPETRGTLRAEVARLSHRLRGILRDVERTAYQLHPSSLDHLGLSVALKSYCADFVRQNRIDLRYTERRVPRSIPAPVGLTIYRVVQEALRNMVKHSRTRKAAISLTGKDGAIALRIRDFGRGFHTQRPRKRGLGIISMEERVRQAKGTFAVKSAPGEGVRIDVRIPLAPKG